MSNADSGKGGGHDRPATIIINGRSLQVTEKELTFERLVTLSGLTGDANTIFTVTYRRGHGNKPEGELVAGESVKVKDGMIFSVTPTNKS
jgi:hypothetical protein